MRAIRTLVAAWLLACVMLFPATADEALFNPDAPTILLLQYKLAATTPPFEAMAKWDAQKNAVDEFHRPALESQTNAELKSKFAGINGVQRISLSLVSNLGEYDAQYGEYDFDINDGSVIQFHAFGRRVNVALTNGTLAQSWKLTASDAEAVLHKNKEQRGVYLALNLELLPSPPGTEDEPLVLNARIVSYDVLSWVGHAKLGSVVVEAKP